MPLQRFTSNQTLYADNDPSGYQTLNNVVDAVNSFNGDLAALTGVGDGSNALVTPTGGTTSRTLAAWFSDVANVLAFSGADPTGVADSTTAIRAAVATGKPVYLPSGSYKVTDIITLGNGQLMFGDGRTKSLLQVNSTTFNLAALGVVRLGTAEPGATLGDVGISFTQPDQVLRANIVAFPPAIYAQAAARFKIRDVRVSGAYVGLDARGNCGGAFIDNFECGALSVGMWWDGSLDFVHCKGFHFWQFGFTSGRPGLAAIYGDQTTIAANIGRADGFLAAAFATFKGAVNVLANATQIIFSSLGLDGDGAALNVAGGTVSAVSVYDSKDTFATAPAINVTGGVLAIANLSAGASGGSVDYIQVSGGTLTITGGFIPWSGAGALAMVSGGEMTVSGAYWAIGSGGTGISVSSGVLRIAGGRIDNANLASPSILHSGGSVMLSGVEFTQPASNRSQPIVQSTDTTLYNILNISGCSFYNHGVATGTAVSISTDMRSRCVMGNIFNGWSTSFPGGVLGVYGPNAA